MSLPKDPLIVSRLQKITAYANEARSFKLKELPPFKCRLVKGRKAIVVTKERSVDAYLFQDGLWRKKLTLCPPDDFKPAGATCRNGRLQIKHRSATGVAVVEEIFVVPDKAENETYFKRRLTYANVSGRARTVRVKTACRYYPEGALSEFTFVSNKWMGRKCNLGKYHDPGKGYTASKANNQLFYNSSGGMYVGHAYLDTGCAFLSDLESAAGRFHHYFMLARPVTIAPGGSLTLEYALFFGKGTENHAGHLSNVLWRLNWARDPGSYVPQTDIRDFRAKLMTVWERHALKGKADHDHFAAHFFSDFFGQFRNGYMPTDQFGCSWLDYDILKAQQYYEQYRLTGKERYRQWAQNIVNFYAYDHYVGKTKLTYPFHTGKFIKNILPFCEKYGWGAPFNAGCIDSLATAEMIYDLLTLFETDRSLFRTNYPRDILDDVLGLQQADGHFRRLYDRRLQPVAKAGWVDQNAEGQTWIPTLLKLWKLTRDRRAFDAAIRAGQRYRLDIENLGLFAMGGSENDYPDLWDVDAYRTMLWAFLDLFEHTRNPLWKECARNVQLFNNVMMLGYNTPIRRGTFLHRLKWKPRGMVATSFYPWPDYIRTECTATGNQSVAWVAYLIMRLYDLTSEKIYADRAVTAMRQVMLYRDEQSLEGLPFKDRLLHTIFENNPQMSDEAGCYEEGVSQNTTSLFIDLYVYIHTMMQAFGGISVRAEKEKRHVIGIDSVDIERSTFGAGTIRFTARNILPRSHRTTIRVFGLDPGKKYRLLWGSVDSIHTGGELANDRIVPEIDFEPNGRREVVIRRTN